MKSCSNPLVIREMQIRTTIICNTVLFYIHYSGKKIKCIIPMVAKDVNKAEILIHRLLKNINLYKILENNLKLSNNVEDVWILQDSNYTPTSIPRRNSYTYGSGDMTKNIYSCNVYDSTNLEATQRFNVRRLAQRLWQTHTVEYYTVVENEQSTATHVNMNTAPAQNTEWRNKL